MLQMTLYNFTGDRRQLNKYLATIATVNILSITDDTTILHPQIIIDTRAFNFNYAYIPAMGRYYYVDNIELLPGERIALRLSVDVLMSHRGAINSSQVVADRSSSNSDPYIKDNTVLSKDSAAVYVRNMGTTPFNTTSYVIQVAGR